MSNQPKEYRIQVTARIDDIDLVKMMAWCHDHEVTIADALRKSVHDAFGWIELTDKDMKEIDSIRCECFERRKRYSRRKNGCP